MAEQLSGVQAESLNLECYCASGGGSLGGGALGTKVPWGDSPERRGGPWAPPPRGVLLKAVLFLCLFSC